jgi:endonuclease/exonuclease/phosphatase family metal-dependent hydrolase
MPAPNKACILILSGKGMVSQMRLATFNVQNLRLRKRQGRLVLDGAVDRDFDEQPRSIEQDIADREMTARVIADVQADVVALQEVFDADTLDFFYHRFLVQAGAPAYTSRICLPGNDGRGLDVAVLSTRTPSAAKSHAHLTGADLGLADLPPDLRDQRLFRRDCLELDFEGLTIFVCHFKAPYPDVERAHEVREAEARAVRKIIEKRFARPESERWIILGDFNEPATGGEAGQSALAPLKQGFSNGLLDRLPPGTDWTFEVPDTHLHSRPDRMLLSPRLAREYPDVIPQIVRTGMTRTDCRSGRAVGSGQTGSHASDHALVFADFPEL